MKTGEIIVLDDREYTCVSKVSKNNTTYLYLITVDKPLEIRFAKQLEVNDESLEIEMINNQKEKEIVSKLFQEKMEQGI